MKIAVLWYQELSGGVDTHLLSLLENWPNNHDQFTIFYNTDNKGCYRVMPSLNLLPNVSFVRYDSFSYISILNRVDNLIFSKILKYMGYFLLPFTVIFMDTRFRKLLLKSGDFDVFISNNGGYPAAWDCISGVFAAKKIGIKKIIMLVHHKAIKPTRLRLIYEYYIDHKLKQILSCVIAVSYATRQSIISNRWLYDNKRNIEVIHNGITINKKTKVNETINIRKKYRLLDSVIVGIVARIEYYKGQEDLIIAYSKLPMVYRKQISVLLIGDGDTVEIGRLQKLADELNVLEEIIFTGYIQGSSFELIQQLDILMMLTKDFEGFGLTLAEAMYVQTPVIATSVGAIPEFIDDSVGTLVYPDTPTQLSEVMQQYLDNPSLFLEKTARASDRIKNKFSAQIMANNYRKIFSRT